jgi:transposase
MYHTRGSDLDQQLLLPVDMNDWVPEDDPSHLITDVVSVLDLSEIYATYREDGQGAAFYRPEMMMALSLYSYLRGARSSREIERECRYDVGYRIVSRNSYPDHTTISRFFQKHGTSIGKTFVEVLNLMKAAGLISNKVLAIDGTKLKASASLDANMTYEKLEVAIVARIREILTKDAEEDALYGVDRRGDEVPEQFRKRADRLKYFRAAKLRLDEEHQSRSEEKKEKIQSRKDDETKTGKKKRGRKPKPPQDEPSPESVANTTDPDSSIMKTRTHYIQGYNVQALANQDGIILASGVTNSAADYNQLVPMIHELCTVAEQTDIPITNLTLLADAGYWCEENAVAMREQPLQFLCSTRSDRNVFSIRGLSRALLELEDLCSDSAHPSPCNATLAALGDWCSRFLLSDAAIPTPPTIAKLIMETWMEPPVMKMKYSQRKTIIEPIFGWIKENRGFRKVQRRGLANCDNEWKLICLTQNLKTVISRGWTSNLKTAIVERKNTIVGMVRAAWAECYLVTPSLNGKTCICFTHSLG